MSDHLYPDVHITADGVVFNGQVLIPTIWLESDKSILVTEDGHYRRVLLSVWVNDLSVDHDAVLESMHVARSD